MDDGDGQVSKQGECISEKEAVDLNPQVIHVNLEDEEVKCDEKLDENCEKGKKGSIVWDYFNRIPGLPVGKEKAKCGLSEALVCSQDWLRTSEIVIDLRGEPEEYLQHEKLENDESVEKVYRGCKCRLQVV
ncbi:hypothetical protein POM88_036017 [Heracleum sosnowskyi]|uniref:Uncharacterized protein n=1 Tax=Heracleum sosnowskyi TaxID=360622 RepID=A0AAD8HPR1_9APIA|nr:hypothetical protein POM88_036017 [Heracleum sosnowskyi]